ncbi:MAG: hypothetical protein UW69_C0018G0002 [Microgenomates group bacterium GW2011_GWA2_44_7]|nr:MAG: hypothetical protein UW69_C0018G0002 [Microgenomates group bacterium GW2011_GWA2_44_7]KKT77510.1 MAG: hypothetical protein UW73_C0018G0002 [Microgenomates group bacterium GW2011_GWB1_44_8]
MASLLVWGSILVVTTAVFIVCWSIYNGILHVNNGSRALSDYEDRFMVEVALLSVYGQRLFCFGLRLPNNVVFVGFWLWCKILSDDSEC